MPDDVERDRRLNLGGFAGVGQAPGLMAFAPGVPIVPNQQQSVAQLAGRKTFYSPVGNIGYRWCFKERSHKLWQLPDLGQLSFDFFG